MSGLSQMSQPRLREISSLGLCERHRSHTGICDIYDIFQGVTGFGRSWGTSGAGVCRKCRLRLHDRRNSPEVLCSIVVLRFSLALSQSSRAHKRHLRQRRGLSEMSQMSLARKLA
jgi:hypothetical protein